jgi:response regulator of citrate/malate metabolism
MRILIVNSSSQIVERLGEVISVVEKVTSLHMVVSYAEAKKLLNENKYDALFLDIELPGNESVKLLAETKKNSGSCLIVIFSRVMY